MRADPLDAFLLAERRRDFVWGEADCMTLLASWIRLATGRDLVSAWHGLYCDEATALGLIGARGGLPAIMEQALGHPSRGLAARGDVGLVETNAGFMGMICTGRMWAVRRAERGITLTRLQPDLFWKL